MDVDATPHTFHEYRWEGGAVRVCTDPDLPVVVLDSSVSPPTAGPHHLVRLSGSEQELWVREWRRRALAEG